MNGRMVALTLSLWMAASFQVIGGCAVPGAPPDEDGKTTAAPAEPGKDELAPTGDELPLKIGEFCLVTSCAVDEECQVSDLPAPLGCCIAGECWRGFRFAGPTCFSAGEVPAGETCPADEDGDGACGYHDRWYVRC